MRLYKLMLFTLLITNIFESGACPLWTTLCNKATTTAPLFEFIAGTAAMLSVCGFVFKQPKIVCLTTSAIAPLSSFVCYKLLQEQKKSLWYNHKNLLA